MWLAGVIDHRPEVIDVAIPHERRSDGAVTADGLQIHRMRGLAELTHPVFRPPRLRLEVAILAVTQSAPSAESVVDVVLRSTQRRLTTAARLKRHLSQWPRHRWRALLLDVLAEVEDGVASALELRYARDVERAHGLPPGQRNRAERAPGGRGNRYRDIRYQEFDTVVELDGREAHPVDRAFRDHRRDNAVTAAGGQVLRYGWRDVVGRPCQSAAQVALALTHRGWKAPLKKCPRCP